MTSKQTHIRCALYRALTSATAASLSLGLMTSCGSSLDATNSSTTASATNTSAVATCDVSTQPVCPTVVPSYAGAVKTVIATYCLECHDPNGIGAQTTGYGTGRPPTGNGNNTHNPNVSNPNGTFNDRPANWDPSTQRDWTNFANITANRTDMAGQVFLCKMPPTGATVMEVADKEMLLEWLTCGAPNN